MQKMKLLLSAITIGIVGLAFGQLGPGDHGTLKTGNSRTGVQVDPHNYGPGRLTTANGTTQSSLRWFRPQITATPLGSLRLNEINPLKTIIDNTDAFGVVNNLDSSGNNVGPYDPLPNGNVASTGTWIAPLESEEAQYPYVPNIRNNVNLANPVGFTDRNPNPRWPSHLWAATTSSLGGVNQDSRQAINPANLNTFSWIFQPRISTLTGGVYVVSNDPTPKGYALYVWIPAGLVTPGGVARPLLRYWTYEITYGIGQKYVDVVDTVASGAGWVRLGNNGLPTNQLFQYAGLDGMGNPWPITIKLTNPAGSSATVSSSITIQTIPGGAVGSFLALVDRDAGLAANQGGLVSLTSLATGAYSGKLTLGTAVYPFLGGKLDIGLDFTGVAFNHTNNIVILRKGLPSLTLSFDVNPATSLLTGHLSDGGSVNAAVTGFRNTWNATTAKPDQYTGYYTFTLAPPAQPPSGPGHPPGYGYGSFTVSATGMLTVSGKQGDGTAYSTPGFLGPNGEVLIYQGLYSATGGSVAGQVAITPGGVAPGYASSTVAGSPSWLKGSQTAVATAHTYRDGFGPISTTAAGTKYTTVTAGQNLLGVDTLTNDAAFTFTGASVETAVQDPSILVRISDKNVIIPPTVASGNNPAKLTATVSASTGVFSGSFTLVDDTDPSPTKVVYLTRAGSIGGIVVRDPAGLGVGHGWFLLPQLPGSPTTSTTSLNVLGGTVILDKAP